MIHEVSSECCEVSAFDFSHQDASHKKLLEQVSNGEGYV